MPTTVNAPIPAGYREAAFSRLRTPHYAKVRGYERPSRVPRRCVGTKALKSTKLHYSRDVPSKIGVNPIDGIEQYGYEPR